MKRGSSAVDRYVGLPYHITLVQDGEEDGGKWIAAAEELPDCTSRGETAEEAIAGLKGAMAAWITAALREGRDIPEPRSATSHSGRLLLRMPRTLHAALTKAAARENRFPGERRRLATWHGGRRRRHFDADQPGAWCGRADC